jgi:coenzyme F420 hydrogenase subunit beta
MENANSKGQCQLIDKVINQGICVTCGACVGICPYFDYHGGRVAVMDRCQSDTWRCLQLCPRADYEDTSLDKMVIDGVRTTPIGPYNKILIARSKAQEIREKAQYGGIVSTLLIYALDKGLIKSAILTDRGNEISPAGMIARNRSDILHCGGSRYTASGTLAALNKAIKQGEEKLAVVGLPCQMEALVRMNLMKPDGEEKSSPISLKIGLFCTWALDFRKLNDFLENMGVEKPVKKYDIPPPPSQVFQILTKKGWKELPLEEIRPFIQKGCTLCQDMTAEWADISVGTVEGLEGWNTVVVRSDTGSRLVSAAIEDDILEVDNLPEKNLEHLKEAASNKRQRGLKSKEEMRGKGS